MKTKTGLETSSVTFCMRFSLWIWLSAGDSAAASEVDEGKLPARRFIAPGMYEFREVTRRTGAADRVDEKGLGADSAKAKGLEVRGNACTLVLRSARRNAAPKNSLARRDEPTARFSRLPKCAIGGSALRTMECL